jgi:hypothetical protein
MNLKYSNAFFAAFLSPIVVVSGFRVGACVDTDAVGAGVDTDAVGAGVDTDAVGAGVDTDAVGAGVDKDAAGAGFEVHPAIPTVANMSKPITRKMTIFLIKKAMYA